MTSTLLPTDAPLVVRRTTEADAPALVRLAQLDSAAPLGSAALVAEVNGEAVAAVSLETGRLVADPFVPTAAVGELLRVRAAQLGAAGAPRRRLRRLAPARLRPAQA